MELDRRNMNHNMNGLTALAILSVSGRGSVRISRPRHRDPNHTGDNYLDMITLAVFSSLTD
jgi:hypothetical protein